MTLPEHKCHHIPEGLASYCPQIILTCLLPPCILSKTQLWLLQRHHFVCWFPSVSSSSLLLRTARKKMPLYRLLSNLTAWKLLKLLLTKATATVLLACWKHCSLGISIIFMINIFTIKVINLWHVFSFQLFEPVFLSLKNTKTPTANHTAEKQMHVVVSCFWPLPHTNNL